MLPKHLGLRHRFDVAVRSGEHVGFRDGEHRPRSTASQVLPAGGSADDAARPFAYDDGGRTPATDRPGSTSAYPGTATGATAPLRLPAAAIRTVAGDPPGQTGPATVYPPARRTRPRRIVNTLLVAKRRPRRMIQRRKPRECFPLGFFMRDAIRR